MTTVSESTPRRRITSTTWACNECKKRKGRCSGGNPCTFCARTRRACEYGNRPSRTPLTRKNLDRMEARCRMLENILRSVKPGIDLDSAEQFDSKLDHGHSSEAEDDSLDSADDEAHSDTLPGYGWKEGPVTLQDQEQEPAGMAFAPKGPSKAGFLGESSAQSLLMDIESYLSTATPTSDLGEKATRAFGTKDATRAKLKTVRQVPEATKRKYIADYFFYLNCWYPIVDETDFYRKFNASTPESKSQEDHVLINAVMALGAFVGSHGSDNDDLPFYIEARSKLSLRLFESGSLTTIQALLLLGNYLQKRDRPNTGYILNGFACRLATTLGLHRTSNTLTEQPDAGATEQMRRRIFWSLYIIEAGFAFTTGRPPAIDTRHVNMPLPADTNETGPDAHLHAVSLAASTPRPPSCCSALIYQARFAEIQNRIHGELVNPQLAILDATILAKRFEQELRSWREELPAYVFEGPGADWFYSPWTVLSWREYNLRMVMTKSLLSRRPGPEQSEADAFAARQEALGKCVEVAVATIESTCDFAERGQSCVRGVNWYAMYFLIQAVLVMDLAWLQFAAAPSHDFEVIRRRAEAALRGFGQTCPSALRCLHFLERIQEHYKTTSATFAGSFSPPIATASSSMQGEHDFSNHAAPAAGHAQPQQMHLDDLAQMPQNAPYDPRMFNHSFWYDPNVNPLLEDPFVAPVFDDIGFFPT